MEETERTQEEREAGVAKIRAWLANLPPSVKKIYEDLRRIDPKGQRREQAAADDGQGGVR